MPFAVTYGARVSKPPNAKCNVGQRPYRSHKFRACDLCRRRKARCTVDIPNQPCVTCRVQGVTCLYHNAPSENNTSPCKSTSQNNKEIKGLLSQSDINSQLSTPSRDSRGQQNSIPGPSETKDAHITREEISSVITGQSYERLYGFYCDDYGKPVLHSKVANQAPCLPLRKVLGDEQREAMEQVYGPIRHDLVRLFVSHFNAVFPILDSQMFWNAYIADGTNKPASSIMCQVYAVSLVYWRHIMGSSGRHKPDAAYASKLSLQALEEEFSAPSLSSVTATLIRLSGRLGLPDTRSTLNCARVASLANCLGLNCDPTYWDIEKAEKCHRIRLWWGVFLHDCWGSFTQGVPPCLDRDNADVPLPVIADLARKDDYEGDYTKESLRFASCHISLCRLTTILSDILPIFYKTEGKTNPDQICKKLRKILVEIDKWEDSAADILCAARLENGQQIAGKNNLRLGFLAINLLVRQLQLRNTQRSKIESDESVSYFKSECRAAAEDIVSFTCSLEGHDFYDFWLPYSAFHLKSAATILVRSVVELEDLEIRKHCLSSLRNFYKALCLAQRKYEWDIAEMCVQYCDRALAQFQGDTTTVSETPNLPSCEGADMSFLELCTTHSPLPLPDILDDMLSGEAEFMPLDPTGIWGMSDLERGPFI